MTDLKYWRGLRRAFLGKTGSGQGTGPVLCRLPLEGREGAGCCRLSVEIPGALKRLRKILHLLR